MAKSKPIILCVDDEPLILRSLKELLKQSFGDIYQYEMAESPVEALELIAELNSPDIPMMLIISDWIMPNMRGDKFLGEIHRDYPHIVKILLTGQADQTAIEEAFQNINLFKCLYKPIDRETLITTIEEGLQPHV